MADNYKDKKIYSWEIQNYFVAIKTIDRSVLAYNSTGIPGETRFFWNADILKQGEQKQILLCYRKNIYHAYIKMENSSRLRTKLFWPKTLTENIYDRENCQYMRFERMAQDRYRVDFIYKDSDDTGVEAEDEWLLEISDNDRQKYEGRLLTYYAKRYERNPANREAAIKIHGVVCKVCGFDFVKVYGELGQGFIEIHHRNPLSSLEEEVIVNPETDLIPVCANCHRMLHRKREKVLSVEELKSIIYTNEEN